MPLSISSQGFRSFLTDCSALSVLVSLFTAVFSPVSRPSTASPIPLLASPLPAPPLPASPLPASPLLAPPLPGPPFPSLDDVHFEICCLVATTALALSSFRALSHLGIIR